VTAPELLDRVLAHAGGAARWRALEQIRVRVRISGIAFRAAGKAREAAEQDLVVSVREPRVEICSRSVPGWRARFEDGAALLLDTDGAVRERREDAIGVRRLPWPGRWDDRDAAAFTGYASWHYLTFPVRLRDPGVQVEALGERTIEGELLHGLRVTFAPGTPAHSREQQLWFTADGALRRNDYLARMVAPWAHAANVVEREGSVDGVTLPDRRRVTPQLPGRRRAPGPLLVGIAFDLQAAEPR
jgi:hypothetical protein